MQSPIKRCTALHLKNQITNLLHKNTQPHIITFRQQLKQKLSERTRTPPTKNELKDTINHINITNFETEPNQVKQSIQQKKNISKSKEKLIIDVECLKKQSLSTKNLRNKFKSKLKQNQNQEGFSKQLKLLQNKQKLTKQIIYKPKFNPDLGIFNQQNNHLVINLNNKSNNINNINMIHSKEKKLKIQQNKKLNQKPKMFRGQSFSACQEVKQEIKKLIQNGKNTN